MLVQFFKMGRIPAHLLQTHVCRPTSVCNKKRCLPFPFFICHAVLSNALDAQGFQHGLFLFGKFSSILKTSYKQVKAAIVHCVVIFCVFLSSACHCYCHCVVCVFVIVLCGLRRSRGAAVSLMHHADGRSLCPLLPMRFLHVR